LGGGGGGRERQRKSEMGPERKFKKRDRPSVNVVACESVSSVEVGECACMGACVCVCMYVCVFECVQVRVRLTVWVIFLNWAKSTQKLLCVFYLNILCGVVFFVCVQMRACVFVCVGECVCVCVCVLVSVFVSRYIFKL